MPKPEPSATGKLSTAEATQKIAGLITVQDDGTDDTPDPVPETAAPAPTPPEATPQTSDTEPTAEAEGDDQTFEIDGEPVTLGELKKSRLRHDDYTRKTMALADERKTLETRIKSELESRLASERQQYVDGLATLRQALGDMDAEPERGQLSDADYLKAHADWVERRAQREKLARHEAEERDKVQAAQARQFQEFVRAEYDKLLVAIPEWTETEKATAEIGKLKGFAKKQYGFDDVAINNGFSTAAIVLLIRDAMKYHDLKREPSDKAKAKTPAIRTARPGAAPPPPPANAQQQSLIDRAAKSHRQRDAVEAVKALLG